MYKCTLSCKLINPFQLFETDFVIFGREQKNNLVRILLSLVFFFLYSSLGFSQILKPATWSTATSKTSVDIGDEIDLIFHVTIDPDWYMYSTDFDPDCGPIVTSFAFVPHPSYQLVGKIKPINAIDKHDEVFGCDVRVFKKKAELRQRIKVLASNLKISGTYDYQVCTEVDGKCIPFDDEFTFDQIKVTSTKTETPIIEPAVEQVAQPEKSDPAPQTIPEQPKTYGQNTGPILDESILEGEAEDNSKSVIGYMVLAFLLGITSLVTPCVFPMIPMTVTFFLKDQSKQAGIRQAFFFGISIIVIYTVAGTLFAVAFGAEGLNALATHWIPNLFVFAIFIFFALSFLGLYEINAPHQLVNKTDQAAERGGYIGVFFMSATLVLVSFSCTLPIVGNVLVLAAGGEIIKPVLGMFAYSLAFAIPFAVFAMFPGWLKELPKSGGWLNTVKVTLGFLELALSLKFLSIADQTYHWGILDRDINIAVWVVIFAVLGFYLMGKIRMPHDSPIEKIGVPRLMLAIATFTFVIYLIPGLFGAPLKALAGYLPPMHTHDFNLFAKEKSQQEEVCEEPNYADFLHLPHGLSGYFDYDQALACARATGKPLFIDFTGHGCTNCREMEAVVWADPEVLRRLKNDYIVVALYVDDKTELPEPEWFTSRHDNKIKKTIGKKNADLQISNLNNNAQPFYVLVGQDERVLAWPYSYNREVSGFVEFLERGKRKFEELY